jgi:TonB family protein
MPWLISVSLGLMHAITKRINSISGFFGLAYLPTALICGVDPHPVPGKSVQVPHQPPGTEPIYAPAPKYPLEARQKHWEGTTLLEMRIRPDGTVSDVKVLQSTGHALLDQDAVQAFRGWKFTRDSADHIRVPVTYSLHCAH